ncbi:MAG TPA: hypothetical protein VIM33_04900 [Gaiellaceae bacterium]
MPEAPPETPGHAGHTPQHVDVMLRAARMEGILSAVAPRYLLALPLRLFSGRLPQLQHGIRERGPFSSLIAIEDYRRRVAGAGPERTPLAFVEGMRDPRFTQPPADQPQP